MSTTLVNHHQEGYPPESHQEGKWLKLHGHLRHRRHRVMREGTAHQVDRIGILPPVDRHHRRTARALSLQGPRLDHFWAAHFTTVQRPDHTWTAHFINPGV